MSVRREGMPEVDETHKVKVLQEVDGPRLLFADKFLTYRSPQKI